MNNSLGRSGDSISIINNIVIKTCNTHQDRFHRSFTKQQSFDSPFIQAVPIINAEQKNNKWQISMPYLHCDNSMVWISKAGAEQVDELANRILAYLDNGIANSSILAFDSKPWQDKLHELKTKIYDNELLTIIEWLCSLEFASPLYHGSIHGDLTLANLLISEDNGLEISAIDFLDVFIDSVILDLCKWRQDTKHFWTLNIVENTSNIDMNRVKILLTHIDNKVAAFINENEILREYYLPFQILNLLRIIPYNKDDRNTQDYLKTEIIRLYNGRTNTHNPGSR